MNLYSELRKTTRTTYPMASSRRGATLLLVLAMLTILLLLGIAFSYSTRLETQASRNYAQLAQARTSAATGLPLSLPMILKASKGLTTPLQNWNTIPQYVQKMVKANGANGQLSTGELSALNRAGLSVRQNKEGELESAPQANITIRDLSGMVNVNAVPDQVAMERVVSAVLPGGNVRQKSAVLMALRGDYDKVAQNNGANRASGNKDDEVKSLDPRDPSAVLLDSLDRLKFGGGTGRTAFTDAEIEKLANSMTVFSQAPEVYNLPDGETHLPRIPLDSLDARQVYDTLRQAFPGKKKELLLQFAANLVDFSDADNTPTVLDSMGNVVEMTDASSANLTIGVEMTPFISEVYPDAETSLGFDDDGQFVEIVNPWNRSIGLAGWTLRTKNGASISLSATLPAGGHLIVTDNYNSPKPDTPPAHGSVVSIFGATSNGGSKQHQLYPALNLVDRNSSLALYDPDGNLVDVFAYGSGASVDGKKSYQRKDPMVRGYVVAEGTPMAPASGASLNSGAVAAATKAWQEDGNTTMTRISQLFTISTGFAEKKLVTSDLGNETGTVYSNQLAELTVPEGVKTDKTTGENDGDPLPTNLDLRLVDVFTATPRNLQTENSNDADPYGDDGVGTSGRDAYQAFRQRMERVRNVANSRNGETTDADEKSTNGVVYSYGKLNLNTCNKYALLGLDLSSAVAKGDGASIIEQFEGYRLTSVQQGKPAFMNVSDFIGEFASGFTRNNLDALDDITNQVTVGSSAFEIVSTNRLAPEEQAALESKGSANGPRPATATARWIISLDQEPYSVISYTSVP